jgi:Nif-specific regulatory protein
MPFTLTIIKGQLKDKSFDLKDETFIGRAEDNDINLIDETSSRHHAKIKKSEDNFIISDLGSNNGTFVNGKKVQSEVLSHGDSILIGDTLFRFESDDAHSKETVVKVKSAKDTAVKDHESDSFKVETKLTSDEVFTLKEKASQDDIQALHKRVNKLYKAIDSLGTAVTPAEVFNRILDSIKDTIKFSRGYLVFINEKDNSIESIITNELKSIPINQAGLPISFTIINSSVKEGESLLVSDARVDEALRNKASVLRYKIGSVICVPLAIKDKPIGAIYLESNPEKYAFTDEDLRLVAALGRQAGFALQHTRQYTNFESEVNQLKASIAGQSRLIGKSKSFNDAVQLAVKIAQTNTTVLILGETGTGKELIARLIHEQSPRVHKPFVAINCAALVETLLESELFGHERGAFTGANEKRKGKFEFADTGTIFLDEIGELSPQLQAKLLRVLEEKQFYYVGGNKPVSVDVRIIAATNRAIEEAVKNKTFRDDLYYRLAKVIIKMPPLRERRDDIPQLAYYLLEQANMEIKKNVQGISNEAMDILVKYDWPGNIRELKNVIEHAVVLSDSKILTPNNLPLTLKVPANMDDSIPVTMRDAEKVCIINALKKTEGKKGEAAKMLGISWPTLNKKMDEYGIT